MNEQLLDPFRIERAVLQYGASGFIGALSNPYFATEIARAANDWSIDHWLSRDDSRLYGAVLVATQQPDEAAAEVRRVGAHPRMAEVLLASSGLGKPFGHPAYHAIYEAAVEMGPAGRDPHWRRGLREPGRLADGERDADVLLRGRHAHVHGLDDAHHEPDLAWRV